jgi:hypothetical protein
MYLSHTEIVNDGFGADHASAEPDQAELSLANLLNPHELLGMAVSPHKLVLSDAPFHCVQVDK